MTKNKEIVDLGQLKILRNLASKLSVDLAVTEQVKQDLTLKLFNIRDHCRHELVVRYKDKQCGLIVHCLCCTKTFGGLIVGLDSYFKNIIDIPDTLQENNVPEFILELFEQERNNHPKLSDAEIVAIINKQLRYQTKLVEEQGFVKTFRTKNK